MVPGLPRMPFGVGARFTWSASASDAVGVVCLDAPKAVSPHARSVRSRARVVGLDSYSGVVAVARVLPTMCVCVCV